MKKWILVSVLFSTIVGNNALALEPQQQTAKPLCKMSQGDYLLDVYIDTLKKTKQPRIVAKQITDPEYFKGICSDQRIVLTLLDNFHEGLGSVDIDLRHNAQGSKLDGKSGLTNLLVRSKKSFSIDYHGKTLKYQNIGSIAKFINSHTLAGIYTDSNNNRYEFSADGEAVYPDKKFYYQVEVDPISRQRFEFFYEKKPNRPWPITGFEIKGRQLFLYDVVNDGQSELVEKPRLVLIKQN